MRKKRGRGKALSRPMLHHNAYRHRSIYYRMQHQKPKPLDGARSIDIPRLYYNINVKFTIYTLCWGSLAWMLIKPLLALISWGQYTLSTLASRQKRIALLHLARHLHYIKWYLHATWLCTNWRSSDRPLSWAAVERPLCWAVNPRQICNLYW